MRINQLLTLDLKKLHEIYTREFKEIIDFALHSDTTVSFQTKLISYLDYLDCSDNEVKATLKTIFFYTGEKVYELSTGKNLVVNTCDYLYRFLKNPSDECLIKELTDRKGRVKTDLFLDIYFLLQDFFSSLEKESTEEKGSINQIESAENNNSSTADLSHKKNGLNDEVKSANEQISPDSLTKEIALKAMERWPSSLDKEVQDIALKNKNRMIPLLIKKIEGKSKQSKFNFPEGISDKEKWSMVETWWENYLFHLAMAIRSPEELNLFLDHTLSAETMTLFKKAADKGIPFFTTPYFLTLMNTQEDGYDDYAVRSYVLYSPELVETFGEIKAWEKEDEIVAGKPNAAGWILPEGHNIHRRYPDVAILIPDTIGRACGGLCASCQRMYDFQSGHLNFELDKLKPKESWKKKLERLMDFFEKDPLLRDILITGGDALMSQNKSLKVILDDVIEMARRKKETNKLLPEDKKLREIKRVRLGSRLLAYLPMRIGDELIKVLSDFKKQATEVGIEHVVIQTHFQSPLEITPSATKAIEKILSAGWLITNQLVYNVAASRIGHTTKLRQELNKVGVLPYYTFSVKGFYENHAIFAPIERSVHEALYEKVYGRPDKEKQIELYKELIVAQGDPIKIVSDFQKRYKLPFVATDRNVLNLPAIGKSMTYKLIGYKPTGERILQFKHDKTREHSPVIEKMGNIYIAENKSLADYMKQLEALGEDITLYKDIWKCNTSQTERVFDLFKL